MAIRKILKFFLDGIGAERYLPFAREKLTQMNRMPGGSFLHNTYIVDDATIQVSKGMDLDSIRITVPNPLRYEFFTSEHIDDKTIASPGYKGDGSLYSPKFVQGSLVRVTVRGGTLTGTPIYSSALTPPIPVEGEEAKWRAASADETVNTANIGKRGYPQSWGAWQNEKCFEYATWPHNDKRYLVTSTQAQAPGLNSQANLRSAYFTPRFGNTDAFVSDYGLDVPPTYYDKSGSLAGGPAYEYPWIWWRRAAVQFAGDRKFFICTDNMGRFQVYPAQDYVHAPDTNYRALAADKFKLYTPPYPVWVAVPDIADEARAYTRHWLWAFNKDATKAVSCPFNSADSGFLKYGGVLPGVEALTPTELAVKQAQAASSGNPVAIARYNTANWWTGREDTPGLVEFGIVITVFGAGDMDFDVDFTLRRNNYSADVGGRYIFDAAYSLKDQGQDQLMGVDEDTLITAEIICKTTVGGYQAGPLRLPNHGSFNEPSPQLMQLASHLAGFLSISANDDALTPTEKINRPLMADYPSLQLSFMTPTGYDEYFAGVRSAADGSLPYAPRYRGYAYTASVFEDGIGQFTITDPVVGAGTGSTFGYIVGMELRTLSLRYDTQSFYTGTQKHELIAYNETILSSEGPYFTPHLTGGYPDCTEVIPASATYIHHYILSFSLETSWGTGFSIHPEGHWAHSTREGGEGQDIVNVKQGKTNVRTTHRELFNKAFSQTRAYSFYQRGFNYIPTTEEYELLGYRDLGSFRTNGVWLTF